MNYKIRVNSEAESKEVQALFQQLGYNRRPYLLTNERMHNDGYPDDYEIGFLFAEVSGYISCADKTSTTFFTDHRFKEITTQQLKDLVVLKRNDIKDSNHTCCNKAYYLTTDEFYEYINGEWVNVVDDYEDWLGFKTVNRDNIVDHSDLFDKIRKGEISFDFSEMKTGRDEDVVENFKPPKISDLFKDDCANLNKIKVEWFEKFLHGVKVQCRVIGTKGWQNMTWKSLEKMKLNLEFREKPTTIEVDGMKFDTVDKLTSYLKSMTNLK